jgi:hypothetical protein
MNLSVFSLKVDFAPSGHAKGLSHFRRLLNSTFVLEHKSVKQHRRPEIIRLSPDFGIPESAQAALAKISIRSKNRQGSFL